MPPRARATLWRKPPSIETGEALGIGIVNAVQLLNPSLVVLAGKFANAAREFLLDAVTRAIRRQCFENASRGLEIRVAPLRKDVGPVGCALLASIDVAAGLLQRSLFLPAVESEQNLQRELQNPRTRRGRRDPAESA